MAIKGSVTSSNPTIKTQAQTVFIRAKRFEEFTNIDTTNLEDGTVLVYNSEDQQWVATLILDQQTIDGGTF